MTTLRDLIFTLFFVSLFVSGKATSVEASLKLSPWYCIGPFKDEEFGNIDRTLEYKFQPELDYFEGIGLSKIELARTHQMKSFPGYLNLERNWDIKEDWTDGFYNLLPRGPAPSRNEAVYMYRTIYSDQEQTITIHTRMQDFYKIWINGKLVKRFNHLTKDTRYNYPAKTDLTLKKGTNHLLIKNVSRWAEHGFSFGIEGLHQVVDNFYIDINDVQLETADQAERYIRAFKFKAEPIPMHSPSEYLLEEELAKQDNSTGAERYLTRLKSQEQETEAFILKMDNGEAPDKEIIAHAQKLYDFLGEEVQNLPPVVFIRKPLHEQNAIAPYDTHGSSPSEICVLDPSKPGEDPKVIFSQPEMRIHSMNLSFDAKTIYFSAKYGTKDQNWQIYKVGIDGEGLTQLTNNHAKNITPCELPNGRIAFISTQKTTYVVCQARGAGLLYTMAADGSDVRLISANIDSDHAPQVTNDGKILFTRWDYGIEKNVFARHGLWTVNPDGTKFQLVFGNTIEDPGGFWDAQPLPGREEFLCVFGPHHNHHAGMIGLVWNGNGPEQARGEGYRWITREFPIYGDRTYADGYQNPFPLNEKQFVVCYGGIKHRQHWEGKWPERRPWDTYTPLRMVYLDAFGNERMIYRAENGLSCYSTMFLQARQTPPVIPDQIPPFRLADIDPEQMNRSDYGKDLTATMMVQDVYQGISEYVERGDAKYIAVMEQVQKSRRMAGGEAWGHTPIIGRGTVHARRLVGLVPIEEDGSASFTIPAMRSISLNVLNHEGKTLMRMGSDMHAMPFEKMSCIGCHEVREHGYGNAPLNKNMPMAFRKAPVTPQKQGWGTHGLIDYVAMVQPVWDKHCIECHSGANPKGNVNMTDDKTRFFNQSYDQLVDRDIVDHLSVFSLDHDENTPKTTGAWVSRIDEFMSKDHCKSEISWSERFAVYCWIDANVPYYGTNDYATYPEFAELHHGVRGIGARDAWDSKGRMSQWSKVDLQDMFDRRCADCHEREVLNQSWLQPMRMKVYSDKWGDKALTSHGFGSNKWKLVNKLGPEYRINLTNPEYSLFLQAPLSQSVGGAGMCKNEDGSPVFADKNDPDYQKALQAIETGKEILYKYPRVDMKGEKGFMNQTIFCMIPEANQEEEAYNFVVSSHSPDAISIVNKDGLLQWQYTNIDHPQDFDITADGKIFCSQKMGAKLISVNYEAEWEYKIPEGMENPVAQVLAENRFLVGNEGPGKLLEVDADGNTLKEIELSPDSEKTHDQFRFCSKTPEGTYLAPLTNDNVVKEFDRDGNVIHDFGAITTPVSAIRLKNGNTLIGSYRSLKEFDASGNLIWNFNPVEVAKLNAELNGGHVCGIVEMQNKDIAFAFYHANTEWPDIFVVDRSNNIKESVILKKIDKVAALKLLAEQTEQLTYK